MCTYMFTGTCTWITLNLDNYASLHCGELFLKIHSPCCMYTNMNVSPNEKVFAMGRSLRFMYAIIAQMLCTHIFYFIFNVFAVCKRKTCTCMYKCMLYDLHYQQPICTYIHVSCTVLVSVYFYKTVCTIICIHLQGKTICSTEWY